VQQALGSPYGSTCCQDCTGPAQDKGTLSPRLPYVSGACPPINMVTGSAPNSLVRYTGSFRNAIRNHRQVAGCTDVSGNRATCVNATHRTATHAAAAPSRVVHARERDGKFPTGFSTIEDAIAAVARGEFVLVLDDEDRENEGDLIIAADKATPELIAYMVEYTSGGYLLCMQHDRARGMPARGL
jgi:hypothetical protein